MEATGAQKRTWRPGSPPRGVIAELNFKKKWELSRRTKEFQVEHMKEHRGMRQCYMFKEV